KVYWALVEGVVSPASGEWNDFMRKVPDEARSEIVGPECPGARSAVLRYRTIGVTAMGSWLEIELETGRTHQIRLQAASRGYPILGDVQYGSRGAFGPDCDDPRECAIALHARRLVFQHPKTRETVCVVAPPPVFWPDPPATPPLNA
ncbi:MAG: RNA pseudouridine synthase, partial [Patescibacteria group bacterium]|nr:RNA pseudouridine synthase [Patescibacteria group bacterium]